MQTRIALVFCTLLGLLLPVDGSEAQRTRSVPLYTLDGVPERVVNVPGITTRTQLELQAVNSMYKEAMDALDSEDKSLPSPLMFYALPLSDTLVVHTAVDNIARATGSDLLRSGIVYREVHGSPAGQATFVFSDNSLNGRLMVDGAHYLIRKIGAKHYLLAVDPAELPPEAPPLMPRPVFPPASGPDESAAPAPASDADPDIEECPATPVVRALVLYTPEARAGALAAASAIDDDDSLELNADDIIANAALVALGWANQALANSGASTRFDTSIQPRLVDASYREPTDGSEVIQQLYAPSHPLHQKASALRDEQHINADLVALVIEDWDYCGAAPVMIDWYMQRNQTAYSVVRRACLDVKDNSLGHELAHSMGSAHDHEHARVPGLFRYSYGHAAKKAKLSTMMAYECPGCVRQPNYANPAVNFVSGDVASGCPFDAGEPEKPGCRPADNVRSLDRAAYQVMRWRNVPCRPVTP